MRNLKRALSLALASVMLLGMMVVGTSAASTSGFTDADQISNAEAVDLTTGLGIFAGYTDGSFGPEKAVTRAEAAVVIAKILHGSDVNPANFAGAGKFTDVAPWAEGYVNLVSSLGIIVGRGEGIFDPDATVTTVEFSTMLLKALGYYVEADALGADWMLEVTSKANALGLYGDLELGMKDALTRENVAVLTMNALFAQRVAYDDVRGLYVKNSDRNVVVTNGTEDEYNTLAQNTYGLYAVEGLVVANGMTDINLEDKTLVVFDEEKDVDGNKIADAEYKFETATDLDMIGHAVTVYYQIVKKAPVVYAIVDEATKVELTTVGSNFSTTVKNAGFDRDTSETVIVGNYNLENAVDYSTLTGEAVILISNSADLTVDYAIIVEQDLDIVDDVTANTADEDNVIYTYDLDVVGSLTEETNVVAIGEIAEDDYVIVTMIPDGVSAGNDLAVIQAAETEIETIVKVTRSYNRTTDLASEGVNYDASPVDVPTGIEAVDPDAMALDEVASFINVRSKGEYVLIFDDFFGKLIGVAPIAEETEVNYAYVAQFGHKINTDPSLNDKFALTAHIYFADGTDGVYYVDTTEGYFDGRVDNTDELFYFDTNADHAYDNGTGYDYTQTGTSLNNLFSSYDYTKGTFIGLYDVVIDEDGKAVINALETKADNTKIDTLKKGVTYMGDASTGDNDEFYGSSKTVVFYVDGKYSETASNNGLTVNVITGMANVDTVKVQTAGTALADDEGYIAEAYYTAKTAYNAVDAALVTGFVATVEPDGVYFYDGDYTITKNADGKWDLDITVYDNKTAEEVVISYTNYSSDTTARSYIKDVPVGFYQDGGKKTAPLVVYANNTTETTDAGTLAGVTEDLGDIYYATAAKFDYFTERGDILTLYTDANALAAGVTATETPVIDLTNNGITSLEALANLIEARQKVYTNAGVSLPTMDTALVSYSYDKDDNTADFIYITSVIGTYSKDYTGTATSNEATLTSVTLGGLSVKPSDAYATAAEAAANAKVLNVTASTGALSFTATNTDATKNTRVTYKAFNDLASVETFDYTTGTATQVSVGTASDSIATVGSTYADGNVIVVRVDDGNNGVAFYAFELSKS